MTESPRMLTSSSDQHRTPLDLSVVVPMFNERENVRPFYEQVLTVLKATRCRYELIFVDDGSSDGTLDELVRLQNADPTVRVVRFRKNFGQTPAMKAGIREARGTIIVTMDGDLQNDPRDIPELVRRVHDGYDMVVGWRRERKDPLVSRTLPSKVANCLIAKITGIHVHDNGCSLKAYRASMIKQVPLYSEMHRFIPAMSTTTGASIAEVAVRHHPRQHGTSKYGLSRVMKVLMDVIAIKMLIAFGQRPLHWFMSFAVGFWMVAMAAGLGTILVWSLSDSEDVTIIMPLAIVLFSYLSLHAVFAGLLSELIIRSRRARHVGLSGSVERVNRCDG